VATIEVYQRPLGDQFTEETAVTRPDVLESKSLPGLRIPLAELFSA